MFISMSPKKEAMNFAMLLQCMENKAHPSLTHMHSCWRHSRRRDQSGFSHGSIRFMVTTTRILETLAVRFACDTASDNGGAFLQLVFIAAAALQHCNEEEGENCEQHLVQHFRGGQVQRMSPM